MKKKLQIILALTLMVGLLCSGEGQSVVKATSDSPSIAEMEDEKAKAEQEAKNLENEAQGLEGQVDDLTAQLTRVSAEITETESAIATANSDILRLHEQLDQAREDAENQYASMKKRIQYMYENGNDSMLVSLLESGSLAEFVKRAEYTANIVSYDRKMVEAYRKLQETIETRTAELSTRQNELSEYQKTLSAKQDEVDALVGNANVNLSAKNDQVQNAQETVAEYEKKIADMKAYEAKLEAERADEMASQAGAADEMEQEDTSGALEGYSTSDLTLMAAIIQAEAEGESYEGKLAVGSVVMNRVKSSRFPNSVSGVIYQNKQFSPVSSGRLALILANGPNAACTQAAREVLQGVRNVDALFFMTTKLANDRGVVGTIIGNHCFY